MQASQVQKQMYRYSKSLRMNLGPTNSLGFPNMLIEYIKEKHYPYLVDQRGVILKKEVSEKYNVCSANQRRAKIENFQLYWRNRKGIRLRRRGGLGCKDALLGITNTVIGPYRSVPLCR